MSSEEFEFRKELREWFTGAKRVVLAGVGNPIRMDDYVGLRVIQLLQGKVSKSILLIECETVPESFMQQIIDFNPTHVLLIDAAILELQPGDSRLIKPASLKDFNAVSTHMLPLRIFCDYVGKATNAKIGLLLIQPKNTDFGEGLSPEVEESAKKIAKELTKILP
jgi:hydrogenase 3 maturation protease